MNRENYSDSLIYWVALSLVYFELLCILVPD